MARMKRALLVVVASIAAATSMMAQHEVQVLVRLSRPDAGGSVLVALCPDKASFTNDLGCLLKKAGADGPEVRVTFTGVNAGDHAVKVFHDVDGNGKLDTNWMGMPRESYGFSRDAMGSFGPPTWEQARVPVRQATVLHVRLRN